MDAAVTAVLERARPALGVLGLATVYRTLKRLVEDGSVRAITLPGENARYEAAESPHHDHFQCLQCRRVYDIPGCPTDLHRLAPHGFTVEKHDVTLYGKCRVCRSRRVSSPPEPRRARPRRR